MIKMMTGKVIEKRNPIKHNGRHCGGLTAVFFFLSAFFFRVLFRRSSIKFVQNQLKDFH